jgi:hypothetical protein
MRSAKPWRGLVSRAELAGLARATQLYAHFTPEFLVRAHWSAVTTLRLRRWARPRTRLRHRPLHRV